MRNLLTYLLFFIPVFVFSNQQAVLNCLSVKGNGDVILTWEPVTDDCSSFVSYEIYNATSYSGTYSLIYTSVNKIDFTYIHSGANANTASNYYFIKTTSACLISNSDTLNTIFIDVTDPGNSAAQLDWSSMHASPISGQNYYYYIYRNINNDGYNLTDSVITADLSYNEDIYVCGEFISYKIGLKNNTGCISFSNSDSSFFTDTKPPDAVVIDTVSVFPSSGKTIISWSRSTSPDVAGYWVYMETDPNTIFYTVIDTVFGAENTTYINNSSSASGHSEFYKIAPFDTCNNRGVISEYHGTIYAFPYIDDCSASIRLEWSHYKGWTSPISKYMVYCKINNAPAIFLGEVAGNIREFVHSDIISNSTYCYYVRAFNSNGTQTSSSNLTCISPQITSNPSMLNADYATVDSYNSIKLSFTIDSESEINYLKLMRAENFDGPYTQIAKLNRTSSRLLYTDYADIMNKVYYYKTIANNKCGVDIKESNIANNIVLKVKNLSDLKHELSWNSYEDWLGDVGLVNIYRIVDDGPAVLIEQQYGGNNIFIDDLSSIDIKGLAGKFCYYLEAIEGDFNPYGIQGKSKSNIACAEEPPKVFMPNAFTPNFDEINDVLTPNVLFASPVDYVFKIFNRWGEVVFSTNNPSEGWNGNNTLNGKRCAVGTYVYYIYFSTAENKIIEQSGQVTLYNP